MSVPDLLGVDGAAWDEARRCLPVIRRLAEDGARTRAKILAAARDQARGIIDQANVRATGIVEQAKADGEAARKSQLEAARAEIDVEINRAREELRGQVARIAVAGAEKVLGREIDANAHRDLLGKLAAEL